MRRLVSVGICLFLTLTLAACTEEVTGSSGAAQQHGRTSDVAESGSELPPNPTASRTGPLPGGAASCVESYSPDALSRRAFAFDGVVMKLGPSVSDRGDEADLKLPGVTFKVQEWFSGGRAETVTVDMQQPKAVPGEAGEYVYGIGSRLLVSGEPRWEGSPLDAPIAWGCGFTRYYDPQTAAAWRTTIVR